MEFFRRAPGAPSTLAVLAGAFNPPTRAHLELAKAALKAADEVLWVLPRRFPHKDYHSSAFQDRARMLELVTKEDARFSAASTETGLFIDVARECRQAYGDVVRLLFLCGTDAARRIVEWDYGKPGAIEEQLEQYELLVADRGVHYEPPPHLRARIHALEVPEDLSAISATDVRDRLLRGEPWRHLVPESIAEMVERCYRPTL